MSSRRIALCGSLAALAVTTLLLGGVIPIATYCAPLLAMAVLLPVLLEFGVRYAFAAYAAVSLLGLLLVPDLETALVFFFFGWYPLVRPRIAAIPAKPLRLLCRLILCNSALFLLYGAVMALVGLDESLSTGFSLLLLAMANLIFLLLDRVFARLTWIWRHRLRRHLLNKKGLP